MIARAVAVAALLLAAGLWTADAGRAEAVVARAPLASLPMRVGEWTGHDAAPFADDVVEKLGVDDYINRQYVRAAGIPVAIYVGYYASQRQGDTIHSPQNCLPGVGWQPVSAGRLAVLAGGTPITVNRYVIQKGLDRQVVFYWYQGRGRVVASEYVSKMMLIVDAARIHRTDGGLVRLISPVITTTEAASDELQAFTAALFPRLSPHLP